MNGSKQRPGLKSVVIVAGLLMLATAVGVGGVHAFGPGGHGGHGGGVGGLKMLMQLDLNDAQKARIRELLPAYRAEKDARRESLQALRQKMRALMEAERFDENDVRQACREMAPLLEDMAVLRVRFMHDIKSVLTPEQVALIKDRHTDRQSRRDEHRRVRESMLDTWLNTPTGSESAQ